MNVYDWLLLHLRKHVAISPLPHMSSWHNVLIKQRDINFTIVGKDEWTDMSYVLCIHCKNA